MHFNEPGIGKPILVVIGWQFPKIDLMYFPNSLADITLRKGHPQIQSMGKATIAKVLFQE